jgi:hypothetical protein
MATRTTLAKSTTIASAAAVALMILVSARGTTLGQQRSTDREKTLPKANAKAREAAVGAFTPEREAAALAFVRQHHAEVADLLENLRKTRPEQYRRAARELFRASERVAQWRDRDPVRYELELRTWKINSRIQLLLARSTMSPDVDVEGELKSLLAERIDVRLALRRHERELIAKRLSAVDADIDRLENQKDEAIERQLTQMRQRVKASRQMVKPAASKKKAASAEKPNKPAAEKRNK